MATQAAFHAVKNCFNVFIKENAESLPTLPSQRILNGSTVTPGDSHREYVYS